jgi:amino acid transporter
VALVVLRYKEPHMIRPFKAGNKAFAIALGVGPAALILYALWASRDEQIMGFSAILFSLGVALIGPILYWFTARGRRPRRLAATAAD